MSGVRTIVMNQSTMALITVDNDLYLSGAARFHNTNLTDPTLFASNVEQVYLKNGNIYIKNEF